MRATLLCAWCGHKIGETETTTGRPSHGICPDCLLEYFGMTQEDLRALAHPRVQDAPCYSYHQPPLPHIGSKWA